ncbi:MAG: STAS domain-containing protein [Hydrogenophaga sp.]|uniref:STAS domain-containing protein n=1 Tax=Hydrogenophaga sp. TaxID=1904254 RepID=UPI000EC23FCE|nr:STAS domain-containing protein [Hydrogenophaga sp.]MDD3785137.1 STAS domain-containing protein [Hydrogenophaga sp.]MDX9968684.1 STAS domain-containing protein [Hydrogenophaga sp.]HAJ12921.1 anti-anti-sigma factor [Comamonadaceae bacterium]
MSSTVALPARLTIEGASLALSDLVRTLGARSGPVRLDASSMQDFDTSAVAVLLELRRYLSAKGQDMTVDHWPPKLAALVRLYGVDALLGVSPATGGATVDGQS